jgi:transcriptional regulator with XRE-family HTH domain
MKTRIRECREERKYTQQQVADTLGISRAAYGHYETGIRDIPIDKLLKLADFYNCTTDELLGSRHYYAHVRLGD